MEAVSLARALILAALAIFLIGDLTSLALRLAATSSSASASVQPSPDSKELSAATGPAAAASTPPTIISQSEKLARFSSAVRNSCLPKLICELNASPEKDKLTPKAKSLLQLIRDTSISMTAESSSRYHFAAHMGQLISGIDGTGCHNFYPSCPLPSVKVLSLLNRPSFL